MVSGRSTQIRRTALVFFVALAVFCMQSPASITPTGSIDPAYDSSDPWVLNEGEEFIVGFEANGSLSITAGSDVTANMPTYIGDYALEAAGTTGTLLLTGLGSTLSIDPAGESELFIGPFAEGDLTVTNQAILTSHDAIIAGSPAEGESEEVTEVVEGLGHATVSNGGQWSLGDGGWLTVGAAGEGDLTITGAGSGVAGDTGEVALLPESIGDVLVDESGSWVLDGDLIVGVWGEGSLTVSGGGQVQSARSWVGGTDRTTMEYDEPIFAELGQADGTGAVVVTGAGSQWDAGNMLIVGSWGTGTLDIEAGGAVTAEDAFIGGMPIQLGEGQEFSRDLLPTGTGTVTVTGDGSLLDVTDDTTLFVGYSGTGTLNVEAGGDVTAESMVIGAAPDVTGTVSVSGAGSTLATEYEITVGAWGEGNLTVADGGSVTGEELLIGGFDASDVDDLPQDVLDDFGPGVGVGVVTVTGAGSSVDVDERIYVGNYGQGTLDVDLGGDVIAGEIAVGVAAGSQGTVSVSGAGSTLEADEDHGVEAEAYFPGVMIVGGYGQGDVTVSDEGALTVEDVLYVGGYPAEELDFEPETPGDPDGTGTVTITDAGSTLTADVMAIGYSGEGTLNILNDATATSETTLIGVTPEGVGHVLVENAPGTWTNTGNVVVGGYGEGDLTVRADGHVVVGETLYIGGFEVEDVDEGDLGYAYDPDGTGTVTVTGAGSLLEASGIGVGIDGDGTLEILNGAEVQAEAAVVGLGADGVGHVLVDGQAGENRSTWRIEAEDVDGVPAAQGEGEVIVSNGGQVFVDGAGVLNVADRIVVGSEGVGSMTVSDGGTVTSESLDIGGLNPLFDSLEEYFADGVEFTEGTGDVTVTGAGSSLNVDDIMVGFAGTATLNILEGASVTSDSTMIGALPDAIGEVQVDGGSAWDAGLQMVVGLWGRGDLTIAGASTVTTGELYVGGAAFDVVANEGDEYDPDLVPDGTGTVTVTGDGSLLNVVGEETLYVGYANTGELNVEAGGDVTTESLVVGAAPDVTGTVLVTGAGSTLTAEDATIGAWGTGNVTIAAGGQVTAQYMSIGGFDAGDVDDLPQEVLDEFGDGLGTGVVTVMGEGSGLAVTGDYPLLVGYWSTGTLTASEGGSVESDSLMVGAGPDATGTVTVDDAELTVAGSAAVGAWGQGNLTVSGGSDASVGTLYIGGFDETEAPVGLVEEFGDAFGTGTVAVTGAGSVLDVTEDDTIYVGYSGDGTLEILNGGRVDSHSGFVGYLEGSTGLVTVDGTNSLWMITGEGSDIEQTAAGDGEVIISNGGEVIVTGHTGGLDVAGNITVGSEGTGSEFSLLDGSDVYSEGLVIGGYDPDFETLAEYFDADLGDGSGTVTIADDGSVWDAEYVMVGMAGEGTLNLRSGGEIMDEFALIGVAPGSVGVATLDSGSRWVNSEGLAVGIWGSGTLDILDGSRVYAADVFIGGVPLDLLGEEYTEEMIPTGTGVINVSGEGSRLYATEVDSLYAGYYGDGTLNIADGGYVESNTAGVAVMPGSVGVVTIDGVIPGGEEEDDTPSTWQNYGSMFVGGYGSGEMTISDGGLMDIHGSLYIGGFDPDSFDLPLEDYDPNGTGVVTVTGAGSTLYGTGLQELFVGYSGTGIMDVNDGGYVESGVAAIGLMPGSVGMVSVDGVSSGEGEMQLQLVGGGTPSTWDNLGSMVVGGYGEGYLGVSGGAQVTVGDMLYIGGYDPERAGFPSVNDSLPDGNGMVTVMDEGSSLEAGTVVVGAVGEGDLAVLDGGQLNSEAGILAFGPDSAATVTVDGGGSAWNLSYLDEGQEDWSILGVGIYGAAEMTISGGGQVSVADAVIGGFDLEDIGAEDYAALWGDPNGTGVLSVTGVGSVLDVGYDLCVGHSGTGSLLIANGGRVNSNDGFIGDEPNGVGSVSVSGAAEEPSQWVVSDNLYVGGYGTGTLTISDGGEVIADEDAFIGYGESASGTVVVTGEDSVWQVGEQLYVGGHDEGAAGDGSLFVNDGGLVRVWDEMYVWETGLVGGDGTITVMSPTTLHNYGTIAPGDEGIGTLTVNGAVVFHEGSTFAVEINNDDEGDKLAVNGDVTIEGGTVQVSSQGTIVGEHTYEIIEADSVGGEFDALDTALLDFTVSDANLAYDETSVWLNVTAASFDDPNIARTDNQRAVGGALQDIGGEGGNDVTDALQDLGTPDDVRGAYDQLAGQSRPPLAPMTVAGSSKFLGTVTSRVQNVQTGLVAGAFDFAPMAMAAGGPDQAVSSPVQDAAARGQTFAVGNGSQVLAAKRWGLWGRGYGLFGDRDPEGGVPGYSYTIYGGSFGVDYQVTEGFLAGIVGGVSQGDVDFDSSRDKTEFDAAHFGLYGSVARGPWFVDAVATFATLDYETVRFVDLLNERLTGNFDGDEFAAYVEASRNFDLNPKLRLSPLASVQYTYLSLDSYTEAGGTSALTFDEQTQESIRGSLGARLTQRIAESTGDFRADLQVRGRWVHEFGDDRSSVESAFASDPTVVFTVRDGKTSRDSAILGTGLSAQLNEHAKVYVDYDARLNSDETVQVISASLQYRW